MSDSSQVLFRRDDAERWQMQTKRGGGHVPPEERGDCVPACIASILGLPITSIANCHGEGWWDALAVEVGAYRYCLALIDLQYQPPASYWIATVPSLNLPTEPNGKRALHCVVAKHYELIHDPSLGDRYDTEKWVAAWNAGDVVEGWALVPLDPVELTVSVAA